MWNRGSCLIMAIKGLSDRTATITSKRYLNRLLVRSLNHVIESTAKILLPNCCFERKRLGIRTKTTPKIYLSKIPKVYLRRLYSNCRCYFYLLVLGQCYTFTKWCGCTKQYTPFQKFISRCYNEINELYVDLD